MRFFVAALHLLARDGYVTRQGLAQTSGLSDWQARRRAMVWEENRLLSRVPPFRGVAPAPRWARYPSTDLLILLSAVCARYPHFL